MIHDIIKRYIKRHTACRIVVALSYRVSCVAPLSRHVVRLPCVVSHCHNINCVVSYVRYMYHVRVSCVDILVRHVTILPLRDTVAKTVLSALLKN